jgi:hypothetical protein
VPGGKEASPEEQLPQVLGAKRVLSQKKRFKVLDRSCHRQLAAREPRFANAVDAFVGFHDHEQEVPLPAPHRVCLDAGYLHAYLRALLTDDGTREVRFEQPATSSY